LEVSKVAPCFWFASLLGNPSLFPWFAIPGISDGLREAEPCNHYLVLKLNLSFDLF